MARRCNGPPGGLANELWADVGYLLNALEHAERAVDELAADPPIVAELPRSEATLTTGAWCLRGWNSTTPG
jgi:hypothetical protein